MGIILKTMAIALASSAAQTGPDFELSRQSFPTSTAFQNPTNSADRPAGPVIDGAGELIYDVDVVDYPAAVASAVEHVPFQLLELGFRADGSVASCIAFRTYQSEASTPLTETQAITCQVLKSRAKFEFRPDYILDAPMGYLPIAVHWDNRQFINNPVIFTRKKAGLEVSFDYDRPTQGKAAECQAYARGLSLDDREKLCNALGVTPQFKKRLKAYPKTNSYDPFGNRLAINAWVKKASPAPEAVSVVTWNPIQYNENPEPYLYPNAIPSGIKILANDAGQFLWTLNFSDRLDATKPVFNRFVQDPVIAVTIQPDGSVSACAPYQSSDSAGMDLKACQLAKERGRFNFVLGKAISKPHYILVTVDWPNDE